MTDSMHAADSAERLSRRRARILPVLAMVLLIQQGAYFTRGDGDRMVDHVRLGAWALMTLALLAALVSGGAWFRDPKVRALLNDEGTRAHRAAALGLGFICAMLTATLLYVMQGAWRFSTGEAIHLIVTAGLFTALLRFAMLEKRALG